MTMTVVRSNRCSVACFDVVVSVFRRCFILIDTQRSISVAGAEEVDY
jgi:hypothetical protein